MKHPLRAIGVVLASASLLTAAQAQTYPDKSVRLIVPWPAGGAADAVGRAVAATLTTELGKTVYVENVAGAGGNIGTQQFIPLHPTATRCCWQPVQRTRPTRTCTRRPASSR